MNTFSMERGVFFGDRSCETYFEKFDPDEAITKMKRSGLVRVYDEERSRLTDAQIKAYWDGVGLFARNRGMDAL